MTSGSSGSPRLLRGKVVRWGIAGAAILAAVGGACSRGSSGGADAVVVVAEVDNTPIVLRDVKGEILSLRGYSPGLESRGASRAEATEAIRRLVERSVVLREGERRGVSVSFSSVEEEMMRYRVDFPPGGLEKALDEAGIGQAQWREQRRLSLLYRKSAETIAASLVSVAPEEIEEEFRREGKTAPRPERIRVRQYLFDTAAQALEARDRLLRSPGAGGEEDSGDAGVDLGFFSREDLPAELPADLFRLKEGGIGEPVPLEGSVSLFRVVRKESAGERTLESESERIRERLLSARREAAFRRWLDGAVAKAQVRIHAGPLEKLAEGQP